MPVKDVDSDTRGRKAIEVRGKKYLFDSNTVRYSTAGSAPAAAPGAISDDPGANNFSPSDPVRRDEGNAGTASRVQSVRNIILQVADVCNLSCAYCSADGGRYGGKSVRMTTEIACKAIDFLIRHSGTSSLAVTYFGGEPLLNLGTVLQSAFYGRKRAAESRKRLAVHIVTNGVRLDTPTLHALDRLGFSMTVSLDGPATHNDSYRPFAGGKGSYDHVVRGLRAAQRSRMWSRTTVRGTFTRQAAYFFPLVRHLVEEIDARNVAYEPVFLPESHPLALRPCDLPQIRNAYEDLAAFYVDRMRKGRGFCLWDFDDSIRQLALARPRKSRCGSGVTTLAIAGNGDIYACHMSTGMDESRLGNLEDGVLLQAAQPWINRYLHGRPGCRKCWARALCGGGCNMHSILFNRCLDEPYQLECEIIQWRYSLAMWILDECPELRRAIQRSALDDLRDGSDNGHTMAPLWSLLDHHSDTNEAP